MTDSLDDFTVRRVTIAEETKTVYTAGVGPAVIVMPEMPGITPDVARFARWVRDAGFTVWMPSLFGVDGAEPTIELVGDAMNSVCVRREFAAFANNESSPMTQWLRQLAGIAHTQCGGPGVGAIGMCFTGNFALSMMLETAVIAPVMSQPSLPLDQPAGTFVSESDLSHIRARMDNEDLTVRAYRFEGDPYCSAARFDSFSKALGHRFNGTVLPDASAGPHGWVGVPHSIVTTSLIDSAGEPTARARDEILNFFAAQLHD